jgi:biopolymer transport protein ExbB
MLAWLQERVVLSQVSSYLLAGGFVMPLLLAVGVTLWTALAIRFQILRRGFAGELDLQCTRAWERSGLFVAPGVGVVDTFIQNGTRAIRGSNNHLRRLLDACANEADMELTKHRSLIRSLCGAAPLLGLLGTVSGMIETFASLTAMEFFAQSGGIAGGISEALMTTQMGLFVAIPGVIAGRFLDTREQALRTEIDQAKEKLLRFGTPGNRATP